MRQVTPAPLPAQPLINQTNRAELITAQQQQRPQFSIGQLTREQVQNELNELFSQQLVFNTLNSDFPSRLEQTILDRLRRPGIDNTAPADNADRMGRFFRNASNATTAARVSSSMSARSANGGAMAELRSEIAELRNLLKLSFDVQLDVQRSMRQEVAALVGAVRAHNPVSASSTQHVNTSRVAEEGQCVICTDRQVDSVFYQCGHMCACYMCSLSLKDQSHNCPVCRAPIRDIVRVFKANSE
jgi:hypothetical protein